MSALTRICAGGLCLMLLLVFAGAAQAHRVNIFAWLEGETVRVECSFRRDSPVRQGTVIVFDAQTGTELLQGRTDGQGAFAFPVPAVVRQGHGLRIRILAGEGHQNEWQMDTAEFSSLLPAAGTGTTVPVAEDGTGAPSAGPAADGGSGAAAPAGVTATLSRKDVEAMRRWTGIWPLCGVPLPPAAKRSPACGTSWAVWAGSWAWWASDCTFPGAGPSMIRCLTSLLSGIPSSGRSIRACACCWPCCWP